MVNRRESLTGQGPLRRVLVVAPAWVGDMVMSQVIHASLRAAIPDVRIDVLAPEATLSLVPRMPGVDKGILLEQRHGELGFFYRRALGRQLAKVGYDQAIITPNSFKSALAPFFAGIPKRTGFLGEYRYFLLNDIRLLDKKRLPRMTDRFLALVNGADEAAGMPTLLVDAGNQASLVAAHDLTTDRPVIGFCPGAEFGDAKKWPEEHYITLANRLIAEGHDVWIFGSPADAETGARISRGAGDRCRNLAGATSLPDAVDLLALCAAVVTNDSGLMHVAAAVGVRILAIYGSTSPAFTPPLTTKAEIISLGLECSPCFRRTCPLGHKDCLNTLSPDRVIGRL